MILDGFWAAIPPSTFQNFGANLICSTAYSFLNCPTHKPRFNNALKVAGLVLLAKTIETFILATWKTLQDDACHRLQKDPEPLTKEIKLAACITSWVVMIYLQPYMEPKIHPRTVFIALLTSIPFAFLKNDENGT